MVTATLGVVSAMPTAAGGLESVRVAAALVAADGLLVVGLLAQPAMKRVMQRVVARWVGKMIFIG